MKIWKPLLIVLLIGLLQLSFNINSVCAELSEGRLAELSLTASNCGGVIEVTTTDAILYKYHQNYSNNELCLWTVNAPLRSSIRMQLLHDGFNASAPEDHITVFSPPGFNSYPELLFPGMNQIHFYAGDRAVRSVRGPLAYVLFRSGNTMTGQGFLLTLEATGVQYNETLSDSYTIVDSSLTSGSYNYTKHDDSYHRDHFSFVLHHPGKVIIENFYNNWTCTQLAHTLHGLVLYEFFFNDDPYVRLRLPCTSRDPIPLPMSYSRPILIYFSTRKDYFVPTVTVKWGN